MSSTSRKSSGLDARLLEIEGLLRRRESDKAFVALESLEKETFANDGINRGLYNLFLAQQAIIDGKYQSAISYGQLAFTDLGSTADNDRIALLQLQLYKAYAGLGDFKQAELSARDALASYRRIMNNDGILDAYNALGRVYYLRSDYSMAAEYVEEAVSHAEEGSFKRAQLIGNLGRIYILIGDLDKAEENLRQAYKYGDENNLVHWQAMDRLSMGYLYLRRRQYHSADTELESAMLLIEEHDFKRERIICLEYFGELAYEKQDYVAAQTCLEKAIALSKDLAPESALLSQSVRRLAEVKLALDHEEEAMNLAQQALDLAVKLGERAEIGLSHRVISSVFLARDEYADARRHGLAGIDILREIGDRFELGRSIIAYGAIPLAGLSLTHRRALPLLQEAEKIFTLMGDDFNLARCYFEMGRFSHRVGKNGEALEFLKGAIKGFRAVGDSTGIARVNGFLESLSQSAISRALSEKNEFKIFGNVVSNSEYNDLKSGPLDNLFRVLIQKTAADRAFIVNMAQGEKPEITGALGIVEDDYETLALKFSGLLKDRISGKKPVLILDCSEDADFSDLIPPNSGRVGSLIILPLVLGADVVGYIYLDRLCDNGHGLNPFSQNDIDFAVGFADLAAFKTSEYQKEKLIEDNLRLKAQLLEKCIFPNIITQSRPFMEMLARVRQVSDSNMAISITGETGTGKDLLAKAIHYNSNRRDYSFVSVNCAALPESLLESELFGYKRGAFTGAERDKSGLFEEADGGTFFLDEIADMPHTIQAKLLRVLENQEITRLGDTKPRRVDVRVLSATNKDLKEQMEAKEFRNDLYYRLCALSFRIPPLCERREDISLLVDHFLKDSNCRMSPDTLKYLIDYDWPGNIRELENEVKKLILLANNQGLVTPSLLSARILGDDSANVDNGPDEMAFYSNDGFSLYEYLDEYEKRFIIKALKEQGGVKKRAADSLNIPESTLRLKLKQYKIDPKHPDRIN